MGDSNQALEKWRDMISAATNQNIKTVLDMPQFTPEEKVGTLILMATHIIAHASFASAKVTPHLENAPPEAQIADFLKLMGEVMTQPGKISGGLSVVKGGKP
jgi:membrane-bound ClpP family serine protease